MLQEENSIKNYTQLGWKELLAASTCICNNVQIPQQGLVPFCFQSCAEPCAGPKAEAASQAGQVTPAVPLVQRAAEAGRKTDCMQDTGLWAWWLGQAHSVDVSAYTDKLQNWLLPTKTTGIRSGGARPHTLGSASEIQGWAFRKAT